MDMTAVAAYELVQDALNIRQHRTRAINAMIASLPSVQKDSQGLVLEEPCPICLMPFASIFEEQEAETAKDSEGKDEGKDEAELGGVTKLEGCGHIFCRRDLVEWIRSQHGSCPTCRHTFLDIGQPIESDDESSDGGEYIPNPDDFEDDDEDAYIDVDGFTDTDAETDGDFPVQQMDLDFDEMWEDESVNDAAVGLAEDIGVEDEEMEDAEEEEDRVSEWGLTDGESSSMSSSEGEIAIDGDDGEGNNAALETEVSVSVHEDDDALENEQEGGHIAVSTANEQEQPK
ncbi:hypothetical protein JR316_0005147 [Psilocybe cubensis]|nr:hypothetical protein JR316_0005147 [Psilocybe cubensis]KAH9483047.1 hypothetical protein JR316_0005147 [Psilocybe cubensis]